MKIKHHGLAFNGFDVNAILSGRKTSHTVVIEPQPIWNVEVDGNMYSGNMKSYVKVDNHPNWKKQFIANTFRIRVDDLIYVRESYIIHDSTNGDYTLYRADAEDYKLNSGEKWISSCSMPKHLSRVWLKVKDIRMVKVKDVTEEDVINEGYTEDSFYDNFKGIMGYSLDGWENMKEDFVGEECEITEADPLNWYYWKIEPKNNEDNQDKWVFIYEFEIFENRDEEDI